MPWTDVATRAERWLLPAECMVCQRTMGDDRDALVCDVCRARWRPIDQPGCPRCGEFLPLGLGCRRCTDWDPAFGPVRSAVRLDGAVRPLVHRFKYQGWHRLADAFALRLAPLIRDWPDADLVPVPLSARRRRRRGYNQAAALATALATLTERPIRADRLQRIRDTRTQTQLTPEARRANLATAFAARDAQRPVILVDDVFTTGATLCSAAAALLEHGAAAVAAVTFARAELPLADVTSVLPGRSPLSLNQP